MDFLHTEHSETQLLGRSKTGRKYLHEICQRVNQLDMYQAHSSSYGDTKNQQKNEQSSSVELFKILLFNVHTHTYVLLFWREFYF